MLRRAFFLFAMLFFFNTLAQSTPLSAARINQAIKTWQAGQPEQAANLLHGAAEAGDAQAQTLMGEIREQGGEQAGAPDGLLRARNWYARAALKDYPPAQRRLSRLLLSEKLVQASTLPATPLNTAILAGNTSNAAAADYWLQRAANLGDAQAQYLLAQQSEARQKITEALFWYEKAAQQSYPPALNTLAALLWDGQVVVKDNARAIALYQQSAELGYAPAMFNLAALMAEHHVAGDATQMQQWLRKAAALGYGKAQLQLAHMLLYGDQIEQNEREAAQLFQAAAEQGLGWAQYHLGILLQKGRGVTRDLDASRRWFEQAAQANIAPAQYELGLIYRSGLGVASDEAKGNQLIEQAANAGLPEAKAFLENTLNKINLPAPKQQ